MSWEILADMGIAPGVSSRCCGPPWVQHVVTGLRSMATSPRTLIPRIYLWRAVSSSGVDCGALAIGRRCASLSAGGFADFSLTEVSQI